VGEAIPRWVHVPCGLLSYASPSGNASAVGQAIPRWVHVPCGLFSCASPGGNEFFCWPWVIPAMEDVATQALTISTTRLKILVPASHSPCGRAPPGFHYRS
jgi:hypothetical protein